MRISPPFFLTEVNFIPSDTLFGGNIFNGHLNVVTQQAEACTQNFNQLKKANPYGKSHHSTVMQPSSLFIVYRKTPLLRTLISGC